MFKKVLIAIIKFFYRLKKLIVRGGWVSVVVFVVLLAGMVTSYYFYNKHSSNPEIKVQKETELLVKQVGKLIELPEGETPTIATILDKDKLKDQTFFLRAENGDKLLAYTASLVAILYRPSSNKIITVAPIISDQGNKTIEQNLPITDKEKIDTTNKNIQTKKR